MHVILHFGWVYTVACISLDLGGGGGVTDDLCVPVPRGGAIFHDKAKQY